MAKKTIALLFCFALFLSFPVVTMAEDTAVPEIYFYSYSPAIQYNGNYESYNGLLLRGEIRNCADLEKCKIAVHYDPWILEFSEELPYETATWLTDGFYYSMSAYPQQIDSNVCEIIIEISKMEDLDFVPTDGNSEQSAVQASEVDDPAADSVLQLCPVQFRVRNPGATELSFEILSWTDTEGNTVNGTVTLYDNIKTAMSEEFYRELAAKPDCLQTSSYMTSYWDAPDGLTVAQVKNAAAAFADVVIKNADQTRVLADDEYIVNGCYYIACKDGVEYFRRPLIVKQDLNCDGLVTVEDARLALRISVGLETENDAQHRAAGLSASDSFTPAVARSILCYAVGLVP